MPEELEVFPSEEEIEVEELEELAEDEVESLGFLRVLAAGAPPTVVEIYGGDTIGEVLARLEIGGALNVFIDGAEASLNAFAEPDTTLSVFGRAKGG